MKKAILDGSNKLVGSEDVEALGPSDIHLPDQSDLPLDGSYAWNGTCYCAVKKPLLTRVEPSPLPQVLAKFIAAFESQGGTLPPEVSDWLAWANDQYQ